MGDERLAAGSGKGDRRGGLPDRRKEPPPHDHRELHRLRRIGWLRAAVLGANDGVVSTASLIVGVAAAGAARSEVLIAGVAAFVAGAMSMAAGEYVSVSSQSDTEKADLERERFELEQYPEAELRELQGIYEGYGLERDLAGKVAEQLTAHGALAAHARDELGLHEQARARPWQAATVSAMSFGTGASLPLSSVALLGDGQVILPVTIISLISLASLGAFGAWLGRAPWLRGASRVLIGGGLAMAATAGIGQIVGTQI